MTPKELIQRATANGLVHVRPSRVEQMRVNVELPRFVPETPRSTIIRDHHQLTDDDVREIRRRHAASESSKGIGFRMLQPHELAAAQGFPRGYQFTGNKTEQVRQIGNAVPCGFARALIAAQLTQSPDVQAVMKKAA